MRFDVDAADVVVVDGVELPVDEGGGRLAQAVQEVLEVLAQLDDTTIDRLQTWQLQQQQMHKTARNAWADLDIVVSTIIGNQVDRHASARPLRGLCDRCDIDPLTTPYELRHTAIAMHTPAWRPPTGLEPAR